MRVIMNLIINLIIDFDNDESSEKMVKWCFNNNKGL